MNSSHHQGVADAGDLTVSARADDGTVEICEDPSAPFVLGVQWHPEHPDRRTADAPLLTAFVAAALGIYNQFNQASGYFIGKYRYNNFEWFAQDNWKVNSRLSIDYGMRFVHQGPQYDKYLTMSNFFPEKFDGAKQQVATMRAMHEQARSGNAVDPSTWHQTMFNAHTAQRNAFFDLYGALTPEQIRDVAAYVATKLPHPK